LGRELKRRSIPFRPGILESAARKLGGWLNSGLKQLSAAVRAAWEAVMPGPDTLELAMQRADEDAPKFLAHVGENERLARVAALAYHLGIVRNFDWCAFPAVRIGKWLGVSHNRVREALLKLESLGLIEVDRRWSYKAGMAQQVRWYGPEKLEEDREDEEEVADEIAAIAQPRRTPCSCETGEAQSVCVVRGRERAPHLAHLLTPDGQGHRLLHSAHGPIPHRGQ
jgi:hypothetical protein